MIKKITRLLCFLSGFSSLLSLVCFPTARVGRLYHLKGRRKAVRRLGRLLAVGMFLTIEVPKLLASALSPFLALVGGVGVMLAALRSDSFALAAGLIGAGLSARHIKRVTAPHPGFDLAFGTGWQARIPATLQRRLTKERWRFPYATQSKTEVRLSRDLLYGVNPQVGEPLLCDLWEPPPDVPRSGLAVIYFHAGAWNALDKGTAMQPLFRRLVAQGHVIMDAAYILAPKVDIFSMVGDARQAIAWLKTHAADYGIHPDRVVLMGASGGGHLALLAAYAPSAHPFQPRGLRGDLSVRAVISLYAPTDLVAHYVEYQRMGSGQPQFSLDINPALLPRLYNHSVFDRLLTQLRLLPGYRYGNTPGGALLLIGLLGGTPQEVPEAYQLASPLYHVHRECPPTLQIFGAHDFYFSPNHGRRLHQALMDCGVTSVYVELPETDHGFDHLFWRVSPAAQAAAWDIERFLALMVI